MNPQHIKYLNNPWCVMNVKCVDNFSKAESMIEGKVENVKITINFQISTLPTKSTYQCT